MVLFLSSLAFGKDCTVLVSSHYRDELREVIRTELSGHGVTALFADELQVHDLDTPFEEVPPEILPGQEFSYLYLPTPKALPSLYLGQLYTSYEEGLYNITTITEFTFGVGRIGSCKSTKHEGVRCSVRLVEPGLTYERVVAESTRDLVVVDGRLKSLDRTKATSADVREYLRQFATRACQK
ncbi:hypothetical protein Bdt_1853 [Bdellovibrio bacteriovorus str. Tiberius]|uniref:Uncharacterized protein n=1 Tax=Bdellovibrio bacteriovorus str. Tiberius TaxID=1069642 RepID=K7YP09_BDEBC|nr:hypothetical protein Bdt_1853 [Bdellovibrio bacteriovorus str. Tiberius]